ncbi:MAG: hypothetical protein ACKOXV_06730 [Bacteroidota bacterium]|jgi:hypothetical protein
MLLEEVMPALREGKIISRTKDYDGLQATVSVKIDNNKLRFKWCRTCGAEIGWNWYSFKIEDVQAENWIIEENSSL